MAESSRLNILVIILFFITGIVIYSNSFQVNFIFDDTDNVQHPVIKISEINFDNLYEILNYSQLKTRPVSNLSFALNHYFGGERVQGYHLFNILIHIIAAIALFYLIHNTLSLTNDPRTLRRSRFEISFLTAYLWLCHPLATNSITYIVQRMNSMATMFFILSLLFYVMARKVPKSENRKYLGDFTPSFWFSLSFLAGFLAIGSKEIAATLFIIIFLYEWFFFQDLNTYWIKKKIPLLILIGIFFIGVAFIYTKGNLFEAIFNGYNFREFTLQQRLLTEPRVIIHYFKLLFYPLPDHLFLDYSFPLSHSIINPISTILSIFFLFSVIIWGIVFSKKERLLSFCIIWFFLNLLIESSFIPLEIIFEHRTYLPSTFFILFFVSLLYRYIKHPKLLFLSLICISFIFSSWTYQRNNIWLDPITFWEKSLKKFPNNSRINNNLGVEYLKLDKLIEAEKHFKAALRINPINALAYNNLADIRERTGDFQDAEVLLRKAIEISPNHVLARINLANLLKTLGRIEESLEQYYFIHNFFPDFSVPNLEIGRLLLKKDKPIEALKHLNRALPKQSTNVSLLMGIAEANMRIGNISESMSYYKKASEKDPNLVTALYNLAILHDKEGHPEKAKMYYQKAYYIQSHFLPISYNFGNFLFRQNDLTKAAEAYNKFLNQGHLIADAHNNLGLTLLKMNKPQEALDQFEYALNINPSHPVAIANANTIKHEIQTSINNSDFRK